MAVKFLCDKHRAMLRHHPAKAINLWQDGFDQGSRLYDQKRWREALPFLGCASETAYILLTSQAIDKPGAYELLTSSAVLLANTFIRLGYEGESRRVYSLTIYQLEQESANEEQRLSVNQYIGLLYRNIRRLDCSAEKTGVTTSNALQLISATMH